MNNIPGNKDKRVFITGATGFVGSYLLRYLLRQGYTHIRALRRPTSKLDLLASAADRVEWVEGDILDGFLLEDALKGINHLYHCAAMVSFHPSDRKKMKMVNVEGTAQLVNAALHAGIDKMVHVSSVSSLGRIRNGLTLDEQAQWQRSRFNTHYAISKFLSEQEVWRGIAEGLDAAIVNPSVILGSGRWEEGTGTFFRLAWQNLSFYPEGATGFVDVRDVARFMAELMESPVTRRRFLLNAENRSYKSLMEEIALALDTRPPRFRVSLPLRVIAWRLAWLQSLFTGQRPFLTRETATQSSRTFYYDNQRSVDEFSFQYTPIQQTIRQTARQLVEASQEGFAAKVLEF